MMSPEEGDRCKVVLRLRHLRDTLMVEICHLVRASSSQSLEVRHHGGLPREEELIRIEAHHPAAAKAWGQRHGKFRIKHLTRGHLSIHQWRKFRKRGASSPLLFHQGISPDADRHPSLWKFPSGCKCSLVGSAVHHQKNVGKAFAQMIAGEGLQRACAAIWSLEKAHGRHDQSCTGWRRSSGRQRRFQRCQGRQRLLQDHPAVGALMPLKAEAASEWRAKLAA
mmetsp:Transcript_65746/g.116720  ORF Transcript_65746/g.116720 Transcript_65746/m.116720 type:complete len:223 (-) Transcript_65746:374-1042(-)